MTYGGTNIASLPENTTITEDFKLLSIGEDGKTYIIGIGEMLNDTGAIGVSADADNALEVGSDGKPYLDTAALGDGSGLVTSVNGQSGVVTITAAGLGAVEEADYNAHTILAATTDNTPAALTVGEQTVVGRITGGNITALTAAQIRTLANVEDGATGDQTGAEIVALLEALTTTDRLAYTAVDGLDGAEAGALYRAAFDAIVTAGGAEEATLAATLSGLVASDGEPLGTPYLTKEVSTLVFDDSQDVVTGDGAGDVFWRVPSTFNGMDLVAVAAHVQTAGTTGTTDIQIARTRSGSTVDMLSTKITIDSAEVDSMTAAAAVIDTSNDDVQTGDRIRFDVDAVSTTAPKGLLVEMQFRAP